VNDYRSPLAPGLPVEAPPTRVYTSGAWDDALTAAVAHHAARICEEQASRFEDDRGRYVANECANAIRANSPALGEMTQVPVRTFGRMLDRITTLELELRKQELITAHADELLRETIRSEAQEVERLRDALLQCARMAEALKQECGMDPESAQAIRNGKYMAISYFARAAIAKATGSVA
jgi:hypothetical protein